MSARFNKDDVMRFFNCVQNKRPVDDDAMKAAADALLLAMCGEDIREDLGLIRKRGKRGSILDTSRVFIDDPLFGIVQRLVAKNIDDKQALVEFKAGLKRLKIVVTDRTVKSYIEQIRPRAEKVHELRGYLKALAER